MSVGPASNRVVVGMAVLLVLAGCGGLTGGGTPSPSRTLTPAPVPGDTGPGPPPGISSAGLTDRSELLAAHRATLENRSYTVIARTTVTFENGSRYRQVRFEGRIGAEGARHVTVTYSGTPAVRGSGGATVVAVEAWQKGSRRVIRHTYANGSSRTRRTAPVPGASFGTGWLAGDIDAGAVRVVGVADGFVLRTEQSFSFTSAGGPPRADARLEALVEPNGRIRRTTVRVPVRVAGRNATARRVTRVVAVGASEVQRPAWA